MAYFSVNKHEKKARLLVAYRCFFESKIMSISFCSVAKLLKNMTIAGLGVALTHSLMPSAVAAEFADFLFVVDESGSMHGEHAWLGNMIGQLDASLQAKGLGTGAQSNRFGLVGYGKYGSGWLGRSLLLDEQQFGDADAFATATRQLVTTGYLEDGYAGIEYAFNEYQFRPGAAVNIVLVTDEDRDVVNRDLSFQRTLEQLQKYNALLNVVVNYSERDTQGQRVIGADGHGNAFIADGAGGYETTVLDAPLSTPRYCSYGWYCGSSYQFGTTKQDYVDLAWATGNQNVTGAMWDLNLLRSGGQNAASFTQAFVDIKVEEAYRQDGNPQEVPEPGNILLITGLAIGLGKLRKDRAA
jgi:hypothetical protein